ncbi:substrate-binding domain-containing protein [Ramlibacter sp.]|uniref:substrate-binding domain-containing protein n=1 Tax=Ramlibacter sp. TaxID=1917967 RepID=UPI0039C9740C
MAFGGAHVLTLYASHDDDLMRQRGHAAALARPHLAIRFTGSVDAIAARNEGRCTVAGFHAPPSPAPGSCAQRTDQPLRLGVHKIIGFARRRQGLLVAERTAR